MKKSVLKRNKGCRFEPSCHAELVSASCCCNKAVMGAVSHDNKYGFTMVEILVAVLIIAVLVIVAVPQYQKSILKSRFSSLMPTTKTIRDSQESYYLQHSRYATQMSDLDVKAAQTGGMDISFGEGTNADFKYVLASRPALHNNLIMYQKQSPKFAGHTHCEALKSDGNANWLCSTALHGQSIEGSISGSDYNTYILEGAQGENDYFAKPCDPAGETQTCECGSLQGTCDDREGIWRFSAACQSKPPTSQTCSNGRQIRSVSCGTNGWTTGEWTACASEAAVKSYEEIQKYDALFRQIRDAQEAYYLSHNGTYAVNLSDLNLTLPAGCQKITGGGGNYGQWIKCGSDLFIDNGANGPSQTNGFLMVEYCPGHNTGYYDCRDIRSSISYYWYDNANKNNISDPTLRSTVEGQKESCLVMNRSSLGREMCSTYYDRYSFNS